jgi:hypothetical protein
MEEFNENLEVTNPKKGAPHGGPKFGLSREKKETRVWRFWAEFHSNLKCFSD